MTLTGAELKTLTDELLQLLRQQTEALETATYLKMSKAESAANDAALFAVEDFIARFSPHWDFPAPRSKS
jgi:hypothetical protein